MPGQKCRWPGKHADPGARELWAAAGNPAPALPEIICISTCIHMKEFIYNCQLVNKKV